MTTDLERPPTVDDAPADRSVGRPDLRGWVSTHRVPLLAALAGGLAGAALFLVAYRGMPDDSYITLDYARNLAESGHWGLTAFRDANTATSPLNVWLLAAGIVVTGRPVVAVGLVLVLCTAVLGVWAASLARTLHLRSATVTGLTVGLMVTSPVFASVVGMESFLVAAVLVGVARYAAERRTVAAGVLTGLCVLTRPDLALPALVILAVLFVGRAPREYRQGLLAVGVGVAVALPWHVWSWFVLGSFVPDSLIIKTSGSFPGGEVFGNGPLFMTERWPVSMLAVGVVAVVGLVALAASLVAWARGRDRLVDRVVVAAGLGALAHYGAYTALGVSSYIWYYCPSLALVTLCAALGAADLARQRSAAVVTGLVLVAGLSVGHQIGLGVPWASPALFGNWGVASDYLAAGESLGAVARGQTIQAPGEIGTLAYACRCDIVDQFSDRDRLLSIVDSRAAAAGPVEQALLRINFLHAERRVVVPADQLLNYGAGTGPGWPTDVIGRGPGHLYLTRP